MYEHSQVQSSLSSQPGARLPPFVPSLPLHSYPAASAALHHTMQTTLNQTCSALAAGVSCPLAAPFLQPLCQQLLSINWTSTCLDLLGLLPLTPAAAAAAWGVLLRVAVQLQGPAFMTGDLGP